MTWLSNLSDLWKEKDCTELWKAERSKQRNTSTKWLNRTLTLDNVRQREVADYLRWLKQQKIFSQLFLTKIVFLKWLNTVLTVTNSASKWCRQCRKSKLTKTQTVQNIKPDPKTGICIWICKSIFKLGTGMNSVLVSGCFSCDPHCFRWFQIK